MKETEREGERTGEDDDRRGQKSCERKDELSKKGRIQKGRIQKGRIKKGRIKKVRRS